MTVIDVDESCSVPFGGVIGMHAENSDVLPFASVAVAVTIPVDGVKNVCVNDALPFASVVTSNSPANISPSPNPLNA